MWSRVVAAMAVMVALSLFACSDREERSTAGSATVVATVTVPPDAAGALRQAESLIRSSGGYSLRVEQSNFVLPQWGGADGGTVQVNGDGSQARAELARTGEQGATYSIFLVGGQTYFQRSTCSQAFRMPGGGADVLRPFLLGWNGVLSGATDARWDGKVVRATLPGIGAAVVELDAQGRPTTVTRAPGAGSALRWTFSDWGKAPAVTRPGGTVQDRGPGGIPC